MWSIITLFVLFFILCLVILKEDYRTNRTRKNFTKKRIIKDIFKQLFSSLLASVILGSLLAFIFFPFFSDNEYNKEISYEKLEKHKNNYLFEDTELGDKQYYYFLNNKLQCVHPDNSKIVHDSSNKIKIIHYKPKKTFFIEKFMILFPYKRYEFHVDKNHIYKFDGEKELLEKLSNI